MNNGDGLGPWGSVSIGPPLISGRYFVGIYNPSSTTAKRERFRDDWPAVCAGADDLQFHDTPIPILDDAVTTDNINVPDDQTISAMDVAIAVQHPRISDLVFHLISPDGTRVLLMENRGGTDPNGAGGVGTVTTNIALASNFEGQTATNYTAGQILSGWVVAANQVSVQTDPANAYQGTNLLALANGTLSTTLATVPGANYTLTFAYRGPGAAGWWRGESNVNDAIYANNGVAVNAGYTNGIVGGAFANDPENWPFGTYNGFDVPDQPAIYQLTNSLVHRRLDPAARDWI